MKPEVWAIDILRCYGDKDDLSLLVQYGNHKDLEIRELAILAWMYLVPHLISNDRFELREVSSGRWELIVNESATNAWVLSLQNMPSKLETDNSECPQEN